MKNINISIGPKKPYRLSCT